MKPTRAPATTPIVFRVLLLLYPSDFRSEFGPSILQLLRDQRRDLGHGSMWANVRFYASATTDLYLSALRERVSARRREHACERGTGRYHAWAAVTLIGMSAANLAYDILSPKLSMGIGAWVLTALAPCLGALLLVRARRLTRRR